MEPTLPLCAPGDRAGGAQPPSLSVYVHFPWCLKKCAYCDFFSVPGGADEIPHAAYADAVIAELDRRARDLGGDIHLTSVYFGGGTPSLWEPRALGRVLSRIVNRLEADEDVEVTVECNPSSFDDARARALLDVGVNRISIGVQALDDERLRWLGRLHDARGGLTAVEQALGAGATRVSADLIFGLPGQAPATAVEDATRLVGAGVSHLSVYALTIEPGTPLHSLAKRRLLPVIDEDDVADTFIALDAALERAGLEHYEISNYARPGQASRHNLGYWRGADYLGLGAGAWGTLTRRTSAESEAVRLRYRNTPSTRRYLDALNDWTHLDPLSASSDGPVATSEAVDPHTALKERIMLGLRLAGGLDLDTAGRELGLNPWDARRLAIVDRMIAAGRLERAGSVLRIPKGAWLLADGTIAELM